MDRPAFSFFEWVPKAALEEGCPLGFGASDNLSIFSIDKALTIYWP